MYPGQVRESNELLMKLIRNVNINEDRERIFWQSMPDTIDLKKHLADNAHLNRNGYAIWDRVLSARIDALLQCKV